MLRSALIGAARDALAEAKHSGRVLIQPLSVAYTRPHGLPIGRLHRPVAALRDRPAGRSGGHSFLPGKPVREAPDREQGMTEAPEFVEMRREPERPGSTSTRAA